MVGKRQKGKFDLVTLKKCERASSISFYIYHYIRVCFLNNFKYRTDYARNGYKLLRIVYLRQK